MYDTQDSTETHFVEPANKPRCALIQRLRDAHTLHLLDLYPSAYVLNWDQRNDKLLKR